MKIGKLLIGVGLVCEIIGTLFITFDALSGQRENRRTFDIVAFILRLAASPPLPPPTDPRVQQIFDAVSRSNAEYAELNKKMQELEETSRIVIDAQIAAQMKNAEILQETLGESRKKSKKRAPLIYAAITLITIGGALEFFGGVLFDG